MTSLWHQLANEASGAIRLRKFIRDTEAFARAMATYEIFRMQHAECDVENCDVQDRRDAGSYRERVENG